MAGAVVEDTILWEGVEVLAESRLVRCVVADGGVVAGVHRDESLRACPNEAAVAVGPTLHQLIVDIAQAAGFSEERPSVERLLGDGSERRFFSPPAPNPLCGSIALTSP